MTPFDNRVEVLAGMMWIDSDIHQDYLDEFRATHELTINLAFGVEYDLVTLTDKGRDSINDSFDKLLETMGVEDTGWLHIDDMVELVGP